MPQGCDRSQPCGISFDGFNKRAFAAPSYSYFSFLLIIFESVFPVLAFHMSTGDIRQTNF